MSFSKLICFDHSLYSKMIKAVLVYISREGCAFCTRFDPEWQKIKQIKQNCSGPSPQILFRQYRLPTDKIPESLFVYERWYPMLILIPYMSYVRSFTGEDDSPITDAIVLNGTTTMVAGKMRVDYHNPNKTQVNLQTVCSWVDRNVKDSSNIELCNMGSSSSAPFSTTIPSAPVPIWFSGRVSERVSENELTTDQPQLSVTVVVPATTTS
jgi:hypothetical protein